MKTKSTRKKQKPSVSSPASKNDQRQSGTKQKSRKYPTSSECYSDASASTYSAAASTATTPTFYEASKIPCRYTRSKSSLSTRRPTIYAGAAALFSVVLPLLVFHDSSPVPFLRPKHGGVGLTSSQRNNVPSSPPHVAPSVVETTVIEVAQEEAGRIDYESGISSFDNYDDPNLVQMNFTLPGETKVETFMAYVTPHVSTFYRDEDGGVEGTGKEKRNKNEKRKRMNMHWQGLAGKFVNLSPEDMVLNWDDGQGGGVYIGDAAPFEAVSTATHPGHEFYFAPKNNPVDIKWRCKVIQTQNIYFYDPFSTDDSNANETPIPPRSLSTLKEKQRKKYNIQKRSLAFSQEYKKVTGREYLSLYPKRPAPMHKMWNADYYGQQHWVSTAETHFTHLPPESKLGAIQDLQRHLADSDPRPLSQYRSPTLNLTLTTLSCAPRVFEITNFLSHVEVDHIVHMATGMKLQVSSTSGGGDHVRSTDSSTRSSMNSWVTRGRSPIIDAIYRRAADLMRIDEALLRHRVEGERTDIDFKNNAAEELQLVHYGPGQQYTPHHDFSHPSMRSKGQPARFATLLLYLNEDMQGGATEFQRWMNSETGNPLSVTPVVGKAVLFYDLLPDGNMDDLSQHSATPVTKGEKWLINLWTWDTHFSS